MKTILFIFCFFLIACVTSRSIATYVCNTRDAAREALDMWDGEVVEVIYDKYLVGYFVRMRSRQYSEVVRDRLNDKSYDRVVFVGAYNCVNR